MHLHFIMSAKTKIDSSSKTWDDGFAGTQRINFGGKADIANMKNFVSFTDRRNS